MNTEYKVGMLNTSTVGVAAWAFYFLTGVGLIILRVREPSLPRQVPSLHLTLGKPDFGPDRPYKTYITTPLMFSGVRSCNSWRFQFLISPAGFTFPSSDARFCGTVRSAFSFWYGQHSCVDVVT